MAETHLVFRKSNPPTHPTLPVQSTTNHLKLITKNRQLELFDQTSNLTIENESGKIWAFCTNLDQQALQYTQEDSVLGFFSLIQDLFRALPESKEQAVRQSHFIVWADGSPTYRGSASGRRERPFWTFYLAGAHIQEQLVDFVEKFLASRTGWNQTGWMSRFGPETFPMFEYNNGEPIVFFARIKHPSGQFSIGYPEIFYRGDDLFLGFGGVPKPLKHAVLGMDFDKPLSFAVRMMEEIIPEFFVNVATDKLPTHPCGLTEAELKALRPDWDCLSRAHKGYIRREGPFPSSH
ncbi:MAG: hypothetical protein Q8P51_19515 [Ignavibacteria bacterium]|nr:hypothetical protein [Ignavibacteria bacterium]